MFRKFLVRAVLFTALFGLAVLAVGCGKSNEVKLSKEANGQKVSLQAGQTLSVRLESNPTTGYSWEVAECDASILQAQGEPTYEQANQSQKVVGGGGWQTFQFKPGKAGTTALKMIYRRPWEKDVKPLETFEVQVTVQ